MQDESQLRMVTKRRSKKQNLSYGDPIILHESNRTKQVMVPFFIPRSAKNELSIKILTYSKGIAGLVENEEKSLSLNEAAARALLLALKNHFAIAEQNDGNYLMIKIDEGTAKIGSLDRSKVANALVNVLSKDQIFKHLKDTELSAEIISSLKTSIKLKEMRTAVEKLRNHLEQGENSESIYQEWCENHTWAFGNLHLMRDKVREITASDHLDLIIPNVMAGYRDIIELKRPDKNVLLWDERHRNFYFSSGVSQAIGQCHRYLDVFHEAAAHGLRDHPEIVAYHPRATIVIGRSHSWDEKKHKALHGLNNTLKNISIMTYDQLLMQGERLLAFFESEVEINI